MLMMGDLNSIHTLPLWTEGDLDDKDAEAGAAADRVDAGPGGFLALVPSAAVVVGWAGTAVPAGVVGVVAAEDNRGPEGMS